MRQISLALLIFMFAASGAHARTQPAGHRAPRITPDKLLAFGIVTTAAPQDHPGSDPSSAPSSSRTSRNREHRAKPSHSLSVAATRSAPPTTPLLADSDFVFVAGTCRKRLALARASRAWRGRLVRAFFLSDVQEQLNGDAGADLGRHGMRRDLGQGTTEPANLGRPDLLLRQGEGQEEGPARGQKRERPQQKPLVLNTPEAAAANESYAYFPSEGSPELGGVVRSLRAGDTRAAAAPFAAHRHFGETYKWMLYGDDDTVFHLDAVKRLLAPHDPDLPVVLSDNLWYAGRHPNPNAPRCLPCHLANESLPSLEEIFRSDGGRDDLAITFDRLYGRSRPPSDAEAKAFAANRTQVPGERFRPEPACPACTPRAACAPVKASRTRVHCGPSVPHGGAGMILSVGLMRSIPYRSLLSCLLSFTNSTGSDHMVAACLWRHGFAVTDPGVSVRHLYDRHHLLFGGGAGHHSLVDVDAAVAAAARRPGGAAAAPPRRCDGACLWLLEYAVSSHMRARTAKDFKAVAQLQEALPRMRAEAQIQLLGGGARGAAGVAGT